MGSENSESESQNSAGTDIEKKILVVDDEPMVREVVGEFLSMKGYEVDTADRGAAALEMAGREKYSLILSDLKMPGMSGIELLKELKARRCEASVIVMTGYAELESAIDALKVGAYDFIRKPFNFDELLISVERALELVHLKRMTRDYQVTLERKVMEQSARIRDLFTEAVGSLTFAIEAKDEYTMGHSERVTRYSEMLAEAAGLRYETKRDVVFAAQLHDIGKLKIADAVLNKPGKLTDEEFEIVRDHPVTSERILKPIISPEPLAFVRHHHERWDGRGYPDGLKEADIPLGARVIAVADTFDAMTSNRAYRNALSKEEALAEIERCSGTQFDPELVRHFLRLDLDPILGS